jgi:hypothetical protein
MVSCASSNISHIFEITVEVYKYDLSRQCEPDSGISLHDMKQELIDAGIDIISARNGSDDKIRVTVCGASTGNLNIYKINEKDLGTADKIGFQQISEIFE